MLLGCKILLQQNLLLEHNIAVYDQTSRVDTLLMTELSRAIHWLVSVNGS